MEIIIILLIFLLPFIKKVPPNTVIIIDRNSHYHKTKHKGWYLLLPSDEVTTTISKSPITRTLTDYFESDDGALVQATISCRYHADNLSYVLHSLSMLRRSVDDIIKSSAHFAISNYQISHILGQHKHEFTNKVHSNLVNEFNSIGLTLMNAQIHVSPALAAGQVAFRPHQSGCYNSNEKAHNHDKSLMIGDKFTNGPIIYK